METARSNYLTTPKNGILAFIATSLPRRIVTSLLCSIATRPPCDIPHWKRSRSRNVPCSIPGHNHNFTSLLYSYTIEICAIRLLKYADCPSTAPNVDDNCHSSFRRYCFLFSWSGPGYSGVAVAAVRLFLAFFYQLIIRRVCGLNLCNHDQSNPV